MEFDENAQRIHDHQLLNESLQLIAPIADDVIASFYERLFQDYPQVRPMFPATMDLQQERLLKAIIALVTHYDRPEQLVPALTAMGRRHGGYGVEDAQYEAVGSTLITTLSSYAGPAWTAELEGAWVRAYTFAATTMMRAGAGAGSESGQLAA
jgi:hemoglobin-like flavoprotein